MCKHHTFKGSQELTSGLEVVQPWIWLMSSAVSECKVLFTIWYKCSLEFDWWALLYQSTKYSPQFGTSISMNWGVDSLLTWTLLAGFLSTNPKQTICWNPAEKLIQLQASFLACKILACVLSCGKCCKREAIQWTHGRKTGLTLMFSIFVAILGKPMSLRNHNCKSESIYTHKRW
jgi:hypothetical protein